MGDEEFDAVSSAPGLKETLAFVTGRNYSEVQRLQVTRVKDLLLLAAALPKKSPNFSVRHRKGNSFLAHAQPRSFWLLAGRRLNFHGSINDC